MNAPLWRDASAGPGRAAGAFDGVADRISQWDGSGEAGAGAFALTRRDFLKLSAAAAALATAGCRGPVEEIVPYVSPRTAAPGVPQFFATAMTLGGAGTGVLVESNMGRPTKIEGNPAHPASLGSAGMYEQAAILELWDPDRSKGITLRGQPATRIALETALFERMEKLGPAHGAGLRILMRYSSSPTLAAQVQALLRRFPAARVHTWEPLHRDHSLAGARLAFGRAAEPVYRFGNADVVVAFDRDFVGEGPGHLRHARDFMDRRRRRESAPPNRLYAFECTPTLAGAIADHREPLAPGALSHALVQLAAALQGGSADHPLVAAAAADLLSHRGGCVIVAGESMPPEAHALVHRLNGQLGGVGQAVEYIEPVQGDIDCTRSLQALASDMEAGTVDTLLILGGNPVYDAAGDVPFRELLARVPLSVHHALRPCETSAACTWHVPQTHFLEHWSDTRAFDGTASIVQPVVAPLYDGISPHEMVAMLLAPIGGTPRDWVRAQWLGASIDAAGEERWRAMLREGVVPDSAARTLQLRARDIDFAPPDTAKAWSLVFRPDQSLHDGEFANNAWLQEIPRTHSKLVWDNAAYLSPASARSLGVESGDRIEIESGHARLVAPVWILPGQPDDTITLALGNGRTRAGRVGNGVGFDAYPLRTAASPWSRTGANVRKVTGEHVFATTQNHAEMDGRDPVRRLNVPEAEGLREKPLEDEPPPETLYPEWKYDSYRWAMVVDLTSCIGCNACTIACQAENNIPTVGKEEVRRGREMHWIRVDRYYEGSHGKPRTHFQPVPCMQCENAPCEVVCPVGATVHDSEGINVQIYNRCVGTRFCSNNCPYKVRRFNFLHYTRRDGEPPLDARNPQVTLRMRGIMEKCNYCLQRITRARIETEREGRRIRDGEVVTACQAACPTLAITFGDLSDSRSAVSQAKRSPLDYTLLRELNTRPRTSYHAKVLNPNPDVLPPGSGGG
ncbi:MAG TPA: 4Fe-4S dicluster domain-containing protein [Usitatibacter sp.]|jgi:molybdopterin-containing oxidoreductase family iron-sulfur binding subunit|nr:4Fe-4S dicluster domain-containing protein [Usitatibacter sp.]